MATLVFGDRMQDAIIKMQALTQFIKRDMKDIRRMGLHLADTPIEQCPQRGACIGTSKHVAHIQERKDGSHGFRLGITSTAPFQLPFGMPDLLDIARIIFQRRRAIQHLIDSLSIGEEISFQHRHQKMHGDPSFLFLIQRLFQGIPVPLEYGLHLISTIMFQIVDEQCKTARSFFL